MAYDFLKSNKQLTKKELLRNLEQSLQREQNARLKEFKAYCGYGDEQECEKKSDYLLLIERTRPKNEKRKADATHWTYYEGYCTKHKRIAEKNYRSEHNSAVRSWKKGRHWSAPAIIKVWNIKAMP